jgi:hypothetical protein
VNVPLVPLAVLPTVEDLRKCSGPNLPAHIWWARGPQDDFTVDVRRHQIRSGADGIAEMVFRLRGPAAEGEPEDRNVRLGAVVSFNSELLSPEQFERLAVLGFNPQDLVAFGGQMETTDDNPLLLAAQSRFSTGQLNRIRQGLLRTLARPRLWPVGADVPTGVGIVGFVAGSLVEVRVDDNDLEIVVQPCVLPTPTALVDSTAQRNPFIGKLLLNR